MSKILLSLVAAATLTLSSLCIATTCQFVNGNPVSNAGPYVGIQAGLGGMDTPNFPSEVKNNVKELGGQYSEHINWGFAGHLFGGYLWHTDKFQYGLELGGMIYPNNKYNLVIDIPASASPISRVAIKIKYEGYLFDLLGVAKYYFTPAWNIFAKEGVAYTHQKVYVNVEDDSSITGIPTSITKTKTDNKFLPEVAVGIGYHFTPNAELSLTYNHIFGNELTLDSDSARAKVASINGLMLGATWCFAGV